MNKNSRKTSKHCTAKVRGTHIAAVILKETKNVCLLSTLAAIDPIVRVTRYDRKAKQTVTVDCPHIIQVYSTHIGGVDQVDGYLDRHKIKMRSRKRYMRVKFIIYWT